MAIVAFHIGVGSGVVCSTLIGNARASVRGTDDKRCSHALFLYSLSISILTTCPAQGTPGVNVDILTIKNNCSMRNVYNLSIRAWLLSLLCLLVGGRAVANEPQFPKTTDDNITVNEVTLVPGSADTYQVEISLVGSQIYTAYQMDILFPPGVDVVVDEDGPYVDLWDGDGCIYPYVRRKLVHSLSSSYGVISNKLLRISCSDDMNRVLTATSGKLLYFLVKVSPYLKPGDVILKVTNLDFITKENAQKYHCKDQTLTLHATAESTATLSVSGSSHYGTCVLPFAVPTLPDGVKAYSAKGLDSTGQLVVLSEVTQLAAYTPYILYSASGYTGTLKGAVDASQYGEVVSDGLLRGAIAPQKRKDGYVLQDFGKGEGAKFYAMDGVEFLIPEGKCWLEMPAAQASAPQYGIQIGTTTGITAPATAATAHGKIYTLDGKEVKTMQPGGIYVVNGKKVLKIK